MLAPSAVVGYLAASLVFVTFCTTRMVPLRALAIASNIAFIGYGCLGQLWPILILHAAMLPMNIHRLRQAVMLERSSHAIERIQRHRRRTGPLGAPSRATQVDVTPAEVAGRPVVDLIAPIKF